MKINFYLLKSSIWQPIFSPSLLEKSLKNELFSHHRQQGIWGPQFLDNFDMDASHQVANLDHASRICYLWRGFKQQQSLNIPTENLTAAHRSPMKIPFFLDHILGCICTQKSDEETFLES